MGFQSLEECRQRLSRTDTWAVNWESLIDDS